MTTHRCPAAVLVAACAASAGIHLGIAPAHLRELPPLGVAFIVVSLALLAASAAVSLNPTSRQAATVAGTVLASVIGAYALSRTTGIPLVDPETEALDALGSVSVVIELVGVGCALWIARATVPKVVAA